MSATTRRSPHGDPEAPRTQAERIYRRLRDAIIDGDYAPGVPLRLQELADAYDVSFIPVREALRRLEAERLVDAIPNRGAWVAPISAEDVLDAYQTRIVLEVDALRRAFPQLDTETIAGIQALKDRMVERFNAGDREGGFDLHRQVHFSLYERSGSDWLLYLIELLWQHTERYRRMAAHLQPTYEHVGREHAKILDALEARDLEGACEALRLDLEHVTELVLDAHRLRPADDDA